MAGAEFDPEVAGVLTDHVAVGEDEAVVVEGIYQGAGAVAAGGEDGDDAVLDLVENAAGFGHLPGMNGNDPWDSAHEEDEADCDELLKRPHLTPFLFRMR